MFRLTLRHFCTNIAFVASSSSASGAGPFTTSSTSSPSSPFSSPHHPPASTLPQQQPSSPPQNPLAHPVPPPKQRGRTISVGTEGAASCCITKDSIAHFAVIVGDTNPIHLSEAAALAAGFVNPRVAAKNINNGVTCNNKGGRGGGDDDEEERNLLTPPTDSQHHNIVAHGTLSIGVISNVLGTTLPGPGTIYLQQKTEFVAPVYAGETVTATVTVKQFNKQKKLMWLETTVTKPNPAYESEANVGGEAGGSGSTPPAGAAASPPAATHHAAKVPPTIVVIKGYALALNKNVTFEGDSEWTFTR